MKDEFEKLDQFMKRNVPLMSKSISVKRTKPSDNKRRFLEYAFAFSLSFIIAWGVIHFHNASMRDAYELSQALDWEEFAVDELDEVELVAFALE